MESYRTIAGAGDLLTSPNLQHLRSLTNRFMSAHRDLKAFVAYLFTVVDTDRSGSLSFDECMDLISDYPELHARGRLLFQLVDADCSNEVDLKECEVLFFLITRNECDVCSKLITDSKFYSCESCAAHAPDSYDVCPRCFGSETAEHALQMRYSHEVVGATEISQMPPGSVMTYLVNLFTGTDIERDLEDILEAGKSAFKSITQECTHRFENRSSSKKINVFWVDFDGFEQLYHTLKPGQQLEQPTYTTHLWRVRSAKSGRLYKQYVGGSAIATFWSDKTVEVTLNATGSIAQVSTCNGQHGGSAENGFVELVAEEVGTTIGEEVGTAIGEEVVNAVAENGSAVIEGLGSAAVELAAAAGCVIM